MELKKNPKHDLNRKSPFFFALGLLIALICITVAFEWKSEYDPLDLGENKDHFDPPIEIPITSFPKPEPPKPEQKKKHVKPEQIKEIVASDEIEEIKEVLEPEIPEDFVDVPVADLPDEKAEEPLDFSEVKPSFPGGMEAFYKYVGDHVQYSKKAKESGVSGRVFVQFVVDKNGELTNLKVLKGIDEELDQEVLRVLRNSPRWSPGRQGNRIVKVRMVLPIHFSLSFR